jgi:hypothetical protein
MKAIGKGSVSSLLTILVDVAWFAIAAVLAIGVVLLLSGNVVGFRLDFDGPNIETGPDAAMTMGIPVTVTLHPGINQVAAPALGIGTARLQQLRGALRFAPVRGPLYFANAAIVLGVLVMLWILTQLRGLFRTLRDGRPFVAANATRLRRIGWAVIVAELARTAVIFFENYYVMTHFSAAEVTFQAHARVDFSAIFDGLVILVIAEVFREGTRLADEQSLTI